jgi:DNA-directed RNA polymerase subunit E'/Rpb7
MQDIYQKVCLERTLEISIKEVGSNLDAILLTYLANQLEGKCNVEGYFQKGSITILSYSSGEICNGSNIKFVVVFEAKVCLPVEGVVFPMTVLNITKAGIRGKIKMETDGDDPVVIYIARDHFNNDPDFNAITLEQTNDLYVKVIGHRYEINDDHIYVIGELLKGVKTMTVKQPAR